MKICLLSSGRSPFDERMFYKIACSLKKKYTDITIISPHKAAHEVSCGVKIVGIPRRRSRWNRFAVWRALYFLGKREYADVYQCEELDSWLIGWLLKRKLKSRLVFDSHEYNPAAITEEMPGPVQGPLAGLIILIEKFLVRRTDHIFVANQVVRGYFYLLDRFASVSVLYNAPVLTVFKEYGEQGGAGYDLCHEGNLNFGRGLKNMVNVLLRLKEKYPLIRFLIVGDVYGEERKWLLEKMVRNDLGKNLFITGWLDYRDVGREIAKCRIGLIAMLPLPNNMLAGQPNKLFNYMRYGLAVVGPDFPEIKRVVFEEQCGIIFPAGDEERLYRAVCALLENEDYRKQYGRNGKKAAFEKYCWEQMEPVLFRAYREIAHCEKDEKRTDIDRTGDETRSHKACAGHSGPEKKV